MLCSGQNIRKFSETTGSTEAKFYFVSLQTRTGCHKNLFIIRKKCDGIQYPVLRDRDALLRERDTAMSRASEIIK